MRARGSGLFEELLQPQWGRDVAAQVRLPVAAAPNAVDDVGCDEDLTVALGPITRTSSPSRKRACPSTTDQRSSCCGWKCAGSAPPGSIQVLAELLSMGQAALVLWWIDNPAVPRTAIVDAITRVWLGVLTPTNVRKGGA